MDVVLVAGFGVSRDYNVAVSWLPAKAVYWIDSKSFGKVLLEHWG